MPLPFPTPVPQEPLPPARSRFSQRLFLDLALPSMAGIGLLIVLSWLGVALLRHAQARNLATYRVEALKRHLSNQGEGLHSLGQMLAKTWIAEDGEVQASAYVVQAALPLLRQQDLVSNLILCTPDGSFLTLIRTHRGWDLLEGGPGFLPGQARLSTQLDTPGGRREWTRLPEGFPANRPWFREGMTLTQPGWMSRPYPFVGGTAGGISYLVPVFDAAGHRVGLVCLDSTQKRLSGSMAAVLENPFSRTMLTDASRRVVVPPMWPSQPDAGDPFERPAVEEIPWARGLLPRSPGAPAPPAADALIGGLNFLTFRTPVDLGTGFQGELWVAYPMAVQTTLLRGWGLVVAAVMSLLLLAWLAFLKYMSGRYDRPMQTLIHSAEAARLGVEVPDLDSDIWEIRQVGRSLKLAGQAVRERQGLEDQLLQTQRFEIMSALSGGVIHDSNNVLSIVMLRIERVLDQAWRPASADELREGLAAASQCVAMNRQLLNLGRKEEAPLQRLDLNACVKDACLLVRPALGREFDLELDLVPDDAPVLIRAVELTQAILNLALNARDAMPGGGLLRIQTRCQGAEVQLDIEDGGEGIPQALQDRIFEPYFTTKAKGKGTGLGLAVVKRVVERHQGRIELHRLPGRGQCFRLIFPLAPEASA